MSEITINQALADATKRLEAHSPSARVDARLLLCHVLDVDTTYLYTRSDKMLDAEPLERFNRFIERRAGGEPVAYITSERGFWQFNLKTADCTLIPREDTECLVECALEVVSVANAKVLDLGTGTGAIALALAYERPAWQVLACDYHPDAVALAQDNARSLNIRNVEVRQSDWFAAFENELQSFDLIVSNPPYIAPDDPHLSQGDLRFEPVGALAAADDGYADIYHIIDQARHYLKPGGRLMMEHGFEQGEKVRQRLTECGYSAVESGRDLAGLTRYTQAVFKPGNKSD